MSTFLESLCGLPFFAKRARATESGTNIDTALSQKQDDLGISASGDAGKFLNQQGQWISASGTPYQNNPEMDGTASAGSSNQLSRGDHVHPTDTSREAVANKDSSIPSSPVAGHYPSTSAVVSFVNSSVATNTANFLGNFSLTDLGVTYDDDPDALNVAITSALNAKTWPSGFPTNNDYVYIEVKNPATTGVDDRVERFKYADVLASWGYEYTLNNSSFTAQEIAAIDSGITSEKVTGYDSHLNNTTIHVTSSDKSTWNGKQDALPTSDTPSTTYAINVSGNAATVNGKTVAVNVPADAKFTDTTYESKSAVSGGTDVSLCTTGEKYTWNNKADNTPTFTEASTRVNLNGSNETMPTILGKVKKWFTDLKALAFKDTVNTSDIANDAITADKVKDNETLPVNISGTAVVANVLNHAKVSSGQSDYWWGIKITHRFTHRAAVTIRCLVMRAYNDDNVGIVDIVIKERTDNNYSLFATVVCRNTGNSFFEEVFFADNSIGESYIGIRTSSFSSDVIPMVIGDTDSNRSSADRSIVVEFGDYHTIASELTRYNAVLRRLAYSTDFANRGSTSIPVYMDTDGSVKECEHITKSYSGSVTLNNGTTSLVRSLSGYDLKLTLSSGQVLVQLKKSTGSATATVSRVWHGQTHTGDNEAIHALSYQSISVSTSYVTIDDDCPVTTSTYPKDVHGNGIVILSDGGSIEYNIGTHAAAGISSTDVVYIIKQS